MIGGLLRSLGRRVRKGKRITVFAGTYSHFRVNLGLINLFPIPILDGGHLLSLA